MLDFMSYLENNATKKNPLMFTTSMPQHPTGFMYLDYGVGSYLNVYDEEEEPMYTYYNIGITSGSVNVIISKSQGGKTTLAIQMAANIIEPYINKIYHQRFIDEIKKANKIKEDESDGSPFIEILDTEKTLPMDYAKKLTFYNNKLLRRHVIINPLTTDKELMRYLELHAKYKIEHMSPQVCPMLDLFGNPIREYPPTVMIIDSMSQLLLEDCGDLETFKKGGIEAIYMKASNNVAGAQRAKIISALYSQLVNYAKKYNIIIFSINHINKMPGIMGIPVKQFRGLRGGETINGGERAIYLASNILRIDVIKSIGAQSSTSVNLGDDLKGHIGLASWIKSKSNSKANTCQLVYTEKSGYHPLVSNLWQAKEVGDLAKSGNFYYVNGHPEWKFSMKMSSIEDVFGEHPELFSEYYLQMRKQCEKYLDNPERASENNRKLMDEIREDIHNDDSYSSGDIQDMDDIFADMINE